MTQLGGCCRINNLINKQTQGRISCTKIHGKKKSCLVKGLVHMKFKIPSLSTLSLESWMKFVFSFSGLRHATVTPHSPQQLK